METRCPDCRQSIEIAPESSIEMLTCPSCGSRLELFAETATLDFGPPRILAHFQLLERLGAGHFGEVWKARDTELDRLVALKIPRTSGLERQSVELFLREARSAAQLRHRHIVPVHEVGREGDTVFIVSDLIRGVPLSADLLVHSRAPRQAAQLCVHIAEALEHAHEAGIVHRDLKPGNIMIDERGEPHLMDFGLAKRDDGEATLTVDGMVLGTPAYMSPEQARGESNRADRRSDIYALGVILYELLTGRRPFRGDSRLLMHQVLNDEPAPPRKTNAAIPRDLETICLKAMAKEPGRRYGTAREMADDLQHFLHGKPIVARRVGRLERSWFWARRNPGKSIAAAIVTVLAFVAAGAVADSWRVRSKHAPVYRTVSLSTEPPGASVTFFPLNPNDGRPRFDLVSGGHKSPLRARLPPGEYLVVAELSEDRFHEVFRRVPAPDEDAWRTRYAHDHWNLMPDGVVELDAVQIPAAMPPGMEPFDAQNDFTVGSADLGVAPPHRRRIPAFYLDSTEVTMKQYRDIVGHQPDRMGESLPDDYAAAWVTYDEAVSYAERAGKRLMDEVEYEVAATDGGKTKYPWGDELDPLEEWMFGPVRDPGFDRVGAAMSVFGLYSNVAEWTSSREIVYPSAKRKPPQSPSSHRVVRGGPGSAIRGSPNRAEFEQGPRWRVLLRPEESHRGLGFRCARSTKPRRVADDFVQVPTPPAAPKPDPVTAPASPTLP